jgi:hypothetical protein
MGQAARRVHLGSERIGDRRFDRTVGLMSDWRLQGQEKYLRGATLRRATWRSYREGWDHDHCEFCGAKFSPNDGDLRDGYVTSDNYRWICEGCVSDFKEMFGWTLS